MKKEVRVRKWIATISFLRIGNVLGGVTSRDKALRWTGTVRPVVSSTRNEGVPRAGALGSAYHAIKRRFTAIHFHPEAAETKS